MNRPKTNFRIPYLLAQSRYTVGAVKGDPEAAKAVGPKNIAELESETAKLQSLIESSAHLRDRAAAFAMEEDFLGEQASRWITSYRRLYAACRTGTHPELPDLAPRSGHAGVTPALIAELTRLLENADQFAATLSSWNVTPEFLSEGAHILKALQTTDEKQSASRGPLRSVITERLHKQARIVRSLINRVVALARYAHRKNPAARRQYSMKVLYGVATRPEEPTEADAGKEAS